MAAVASRLEYLLANQNADGGWGYFPGRESRTEPTAWALRALAPHHPAAVRGIDFLLSREQPDHGLAPAPSVPGSTWVTALAFPVLHRAAVGKEVLERMAEWILRTEGAEGGLKMRLLRAMGKMPVDQDPRLKGWPWRPGNNSWVEPTAHGLVALAWMGTYAPANIIRYRAEMGAQMLLDRQCVDLGWNYGNKRVLGEVLPSYPETTGLALLGLAASSLWTAATAQRDRTVALDHAQALLEQTPGAYARALLTLALQAHGREIYYQPPTEGRHASGNLLLTALEILAAQSSRPVLLP